MLYKELLADPLYLTAFSAIASFLFCTFSYPFYIKWLKAKQIEQYIREEGPKSHAHKSRTPTMGGLVFIAGIIIASLAGILSSSSQPLKDNELSAVYIALFISFCCGMLGLADDYGKVTSKSNTGISARTRLLCEFGLGLLLALALLQFNLLAPISLGMAGMQELEPGTFLPIREGPLLYAYVFLVLPFLLAASSNALNLHDGMDGLAAGSSFLVFSTMAILLFCLKFFFLSALAAAAAAAMLSFLIFNRYPARLFMGDTGSLFIGALMASLVASSGLIIWFIPLSLIFVAETISVMAQVLYFKLTKPFSPAKAMSKPALILYKLRHKLPGEGKRLFRMAPLHHHFEAVFAEKGQKEWQVVLYFWLAQLLLSLSCLFAFQQF